MSKKFQLKRWTIAAFALPSIPIAALGLPITVYLPPFYAQDVGLSLGIVGMIFMVTRFWDIFTDPVLGIVSDRVQSRWGRRRHWIVLSVPVLMLSVYMVFMPMEGANWLYLMAWMVILYIGYTLATISHMSWGAELSPDYHERSRVQGWREFALIFGMLAVLAMPAALELMADDPSGHDRMAAMGWFIVILLPITVAIAVFFVHERPLPERETQNIPWRRAAHIIAANKPLRRVLLADLLVGFAPAVTGSLYIFFIQSAIGLPGIASLLLLIYFAAAVVGIPIWIQISYRIGKHRTLAYGMFYGALILPTFLLGTHVPYFMTDAGHPPIMLIVAMNIAYGIAYGAGPFLLRAIMADVCDHDRLQTGQQRTGIYFSLLTLTNKAGYALGIGVTYIVLEMLGYNTVRGAENTQFAIDGLTFMFIFLPMGFMILAGIVMWRFPLDQEAQRRLREQLAELEASEMARGSPMPNEIIGGLADIGDDDDGTERTPAK
jgi:GPH family glycoside/pentoside/hexuronide:cation symporter